jgi:hypothetical protein
VKIGVVAAIAIALLAIALAIVIGSRLSDQAVAALAGAACGVGLAGPLGLTLGIYAGAARGRAASQTTHAPLPPQVIVIPAPPAPASNAPAYHPAPGAFLPSARTFTIIGEEEES